MIPSMHDIVAESQGPQGEKNDGLVSPATQSSVA